MIGLPGMVNGDGIQAFRQTAFGGYNHTLGAHNGEIYDMENLTGDHYPLLSPRKPRYLLRTLEKPNGIYAHDGLFTVDGTRMELNGVTIGTVEDSRKMFCSMGNRVIIFPDKLCYNLSSGELSHLEASYSATGLVFGNGTYAGEAAELNSITTTGDTFPFLAGDAVTISGCSVEEHNKTSIIREISQDGRTLRFYENVFVQEVTEAGRVTLARTVPDLDYICENENRLWGCKGDTIWASKLGDPFNWYVFDGVATDAFSVDVGSTGDFTGCTSFLGYPVFFKDGTICKVYGDRPSNFQVMSSASLGVEDGSGGSLAVAGEVLFYLSRIGVVAYSGGIPQSVAAPFGTERYRNAVAGSDGVKYYVCLEDVRGDHHLFVYDTLRKLWHREDGLNVLGFGWDGELYILDSDGNLFLNGNARQIPEGAQEEEISWMAEWSDFYESAGELMTQAIQIKKHIGKLLLRMELEENSTVTVWISFDSMGEWHKASQLRATNKRSFYLPIIPRRCDHFGLKLTGTGDCKVYSLTREVAAGSPND